MRSVSVCISQHVGEHFSGVREVLFMRFFDNPISKNGVGMRSDHAASPTLRKGPFRHVSAFSVEHDQTLGNVVESLQVMEEKPRHLCAMHVPNGHISVNGFHVFRHFADRSIVSEGVVLSVDVVEQSGSLESSVDSGVDLGLIILGNGRYFESFELLVPNSLSLGLDLVE